MKRLTVGLLLGLLLAGGVALAQRGDPYSTQAIQWMEDAFNASGTIVYPNFAADPYTCAAGFSGGYYFNTTSSTFQLCDGTAWGAGGLLTVGTANTIPKWNAVPDDLVDSLLSDDGTDLTSTATQIRIVGGNDSNNPSIIWTADDDATGTGIHRGAADTISFSANGINRMHIDTDITLLGQLTIQDGDFNDPSIVFSDDDDGTGTGLYRVQADDIGFTTNGVQRFRLDATPAAGSGGILAEISYDLNAMDDDTDISRGLFIDSGDGGNHTGAVSSPEEYAIDIDDITGDAQAVEVGLRIGAGWDTGIILPDGSNASPAIVFGSELNTGLYTDGTSRIRFAIDGSVEATLFNNIWSIQGAGTAATPGLTLGGDSDTGFYSIGANQLGISTGGDLVFTFNDEPVAGAEGNILATAPTLAAMDGADDPQIINIFDINVTNADHTDAGQTNTISGINLTIDALDAEAQEIALNVAAGWEVGLKLDDGTDTDDNIIFGADDDVSMFWSDGTNGFIIDATDTASADMYFLLEASNVAFFQIDWVGLGSEVTWFGGNAAGGSIVIQDMNLGYMGIMDGSDNFTALQVDITNVNHTGTGNTVLGVDIDGITQDADATETAIVARGGWDLSARFDDAIEKNAYRQDFNGSCLKVEEADFTAELLVDTGVNHAICDGQIKNFSYYLNGDQASPFLVNVNGTGLDTDNDAIDNEGTELILSDRAVTADGWYIRGQSTAMYMRASITIASIDGTDRVYAGWRISEAFNATQAVGAYDTYAVHTINDSAGNNQIQTDVNGVATGTDENDVDAVWADTETHILEVRLSTACVATFYYDDAQVTVSNANDACEAGDVMIPVIGHRQFTNADTELIVNWIEVGEVI